MAQPLTIPFIQEIQSENNGNIPVNLLSPMVAMAITDLEGPDERRPSSETLDYLNDALTNQNPTYTISSLLTTDALDNVSKNFDTEIDLKLSFTDRIKIYLLLPYFRDFPMSQLLIKITSDDDMKGPDLTDLNLLKLLIADIKVPQEKSPTTAIVMLSLIDAADSSGGILYNKTKQLLQMYKLFALENNGEVITDKLLMKAHYKPIPSTSDAEIDILFTNRGKFYELDRFVSHKFYANTILPAQNLLRCIYSRAIQYHFDVPQSGTAVDITVEKFITVNSKRTTARGSRSSSSSSSSGACCDGAGCGSAGCGGSLTTTLITVTAVFSHLWNTFSFSMLDITKSNTMIYKNKSSPESQGKAFTLSVKPKNAYEFCVAGMTHLHGSFSASRLYEDLALIDITNVSLPVGYEPVVNIGGISQ